MFGQLKGIYVLIMTVSFVVAAAVDPPGGALDGEKPRVFISTDIGPGGDIDDEQSMAAALLFADVFDIEGLDGDTATINSAITAYKQDYAKLSTWGQYPAAELLKGKVAGGTNSVNLLISAALKPDTRPLWVLVWGGLGTVAEALRKNPSIKRSIRIYSIGYQDRGSHDYIRNSHSDVWWIENLESFQGVWCGGEGEWSNTGFIDKHVNGHGALGNWYAVQDDAISWWRGFREGDSPSFHYLLKGNPDNPDSDHWGGRFKKNSTGANRWIDGDGAPCWNPSACSNPCYGEASISKYRLNYLGEYAKRFDRAKIAAATIIQDRHGPGQSISGTKTTDRCCDLYGRKMTGDAVGVQVFRSKTHGVMLRVSSTAAGPACRK